ncbi:MAG: PDZ domain-containing protein, partial [Candidatus Thorarchaeota archaeon]|nr:PDZ domain-containing protein [Candidatus Thorarchaeota archaeon]
IVAGDIIFRLDDVDVYRIEDLLKEIHKRKVGEKIRIFILRRGKEHFFEVTLSKMP